MQMEKGTKTRLMKAHVSIASPAERVTGRVRVER